MASGIRSSLACIASRTPSCFQRLIRFNLSGVHLGLSGQVKQAVRLALRRLDLGGDLIEGLLRNLDRTADLVEIGRCRKLCDVAQFGFG
jgi:hypothetical protein